MKESINLVSTFVDNKPRKVYNLGKLKSYLKAFNAAASILLILELVALGFVNWQMKTRSLAKTASEKKLASLTGDAKLIDSLLTRQKQLDYIEKQRPDLKSTASLIQKEVPGDVTLNNLKIYNDHVVISAKTVGVSSFSQFVNNLVTSKYFKKISLTQSVYNQDFGTFNFTLECLIN